MPAKKDPFELVLDRDAFDAAARDRLPKITKQKDMAELLGLTQSVWSLYRNRKRVLNGPFVATAINVLPGVPVQSYCRSVRASELSQP